MHCHEGSQSCQQEKVHLVYQMSLLSGEDIVQIQHVQGRRTSCPVGLISQSLSVLKIYLSLIFFDFLQRATQNSLTWWWLIGWRSYFNLSYEKKNFIFVSQKLLFTKAGILMSGCCGTNSPNCVRYFTK